MVLKNVITRIKTAYRKFYRPGRIDVALRRRDILSCIYAASSLCFFISVMYSYSHWKEQPEVKKKLESFRARDTYALRVGGDKWFEILPPGSYNIEETSEK